MVSADYKNLTLSSVMAGCKHPQELELLTRVSIDDGRGRALWEWIQEREADLPTPTEISFGVLVAREVDVPDLGTVGIACGLFPTTTVITAAQGPIPRFICLEPLLHLISIRQNPE